MKDTVYHSTDILSNLILSYICNDIKDILFYLRKRSRDVHYYMFSELRNVRNDNFIETNYVI